MAAASTAASSAAADNATQTAPTAMGVAAAGASAAEAATAVTASTLSTPAASAAGGGAIAATTAAGAAGAAAAQQMFTVHITDFDGYFWLHAQPQDQAQTPAPADTKQPPAAGGGGGGGGGGIFAALGLAKKPKAPPTAAVPDSGPDVRGARMRELMAQLYDAVLRDHDTGFHFFYEPEIIVRVSSAAVALRVSAWLSARHPPLPHAIYRYPSPHPLPPKPEPDAAAGKGKGKGKHKGKGKSQPPQGAADPKNDADGKSASAAAAAAGNSAGDTSAGAAAAGAGAAAAGASAAPGAEWGGVEPDAEERECARLGLGPAGADPRRRPTTRRYCEEPDGVVLRHLRVFLPLFHAHAVAALSMSGADHRRYMERAVHTMWNPAMYTRRAEGQALTRMGAYKLGAVGAIQYLEHNAATIYDDVLTLSAKAGVVAAPPSAGGTATASKLANGSSAAGSAPNTGRSAASNTPAAAAAGGGGGAAASGVAQAAGQSSSSSSSSATKSYTLTFGKRFQINKRGKIGSGSFGDIYEGIDLETREPVAVKLESVKARHRQLAAEFDIYKQLTPHAGIPNVRWFGKEGDYYVMVMDLLGQNLETLFNRCNRKLTLKTILMLADQMITRLEFLHARNYLHRDIKPENFVMGIGACNGGAPVAPGSLSNTVHLIDFGLARQYRDPKTHAHAPYREHASLTGTARYASINAHLGIEQSRRDDMESLGIVLVYFALDGHLPWQGLQGVSQRAKLQRIMDTKISTPLDLLCRGLPLAFLKYLTHCRDLRFLNKPDYGYLRGLFRDLWKQHGFVEDGVFDWTNLPPFEEAKALEIAKNDKKLAAAQAGNTAMAVGAAFAPSPTAAAAAAAAAQASSAALTTNREKDKREAKQQQQLAAATAALAGPPAAGAGMPPLPRQPSSGSAAQRAQHQPTQQPRASATAAAAATALGDDPIACCHSPLPLQQHIRDDHFTAPLAAQPLPFVPGAGPASGRGASPRGSGGATAPAAATGGSGGARSPTNAGSGAGPSGRTSVAGAVPRASSSRAMPQHNISAAAAGVQVSG